MAKGIVDATGDGDVNHLAGGSYTKGDAGKMIRIPIFPETLILHGQVSDPMSFPSIQPEYMMWMVLMPMI